MSMQSYMVGDYVRIMYGRAMSDVAEPLGSFWLVEDVGSLGDALELGFAL